MIKKKFSLAISFLFLSFISFGQQADIDTIHNRLVTSMLSPTVDVAAVTGFMNTMNTNGSWTDINYADKSVTGWKPLTHLNRLISMAVAYRKQGNSLYNSSSLRDKIVLGINFYFNTKPTSDNWFYNNIAGPRNYGTVLILLKGYIPTTTLVNYSSYLVDRIDQYITDGDNLIGVSKITMFKGSLENNFNLMTRSFDGVASSLSINPSVPAPNLGDVGFKADFSYHQHRQQLYIGGYGIDYMASIMSYIELSERTSFASQFTAQRKQLYSDVMLKGVQSFGYRGVLDFGSLGRYISRPNGTINIDTATLDKIKLKVDQPNASAYDAWKKHLLGGVAGISGNRHFWKSDIMTQHGPNYYMSAKIISTRTLGTEVINDENRKYFNLPLGATNIMTRGVEYKTIFPVWDWSRIPGTTSEMNPDLAPIALGTSTYLYGTNQFAGGASSGTAGVTAFEHDYYGVKAKKSYFFMGDMMLCLGNGITASKTNSIVTSVNQSALSGPITVSSAAGVQTFTGSMYQDLKNTQWIHHDNVGYITSGYPMTVQAKTQSGSWNSINNSQSSTIQNADIFSLWFNHSSTPSNRTYMYIVAPDRSVDEIKTLYTNHGFVVVQNDANAQAVRNDNVRQYAVVFYNPGTVDMGNGLTITSDQKAIVLIEKKSTPTYKITVADPLYNQSAITVTLNKNLTGTNAVYASGKTAIGFSLPTGEYAGSSVSKFYTINEPQVVITSPSKSTPFNAPAMCTIQASTDVSATGVAIAKVEFFNGTTKLGEDLSSPFEFNWTNISAGTYSITAKATDVDGIYGVSSPATFTVNKPDLSICTSVIASTNDGNVETNVLDNNLNTRWSASGDGQWMMFCLDSITEMNAIKIAFFSGNIRQSIFDVLVSNDGISWSTVLTSVKSSGKSLDLETFSFANKNGKFVKIVGHGNTSNPWNSYAEVKIIPVDKLCLPASASSDDGNIATNVLDNDLNTRWSALGDGQSIQFCLGSLMDISAVQIAFYNGNIRQSIFDVLVSTDGTTWSTVLASVKSSGKSLAFETFSFATKNAKYVKIVGHGNTSNAWNSYTEVKVVPVVMPSYQIPVIASVNLSSAIISANEGIQPNPASGESSVKIKVNSNFSGDETVTVISSDGAIAKNETINLQTGDNSIAIVVSDLKQGLYLIKVGEKTFRFVKGE